MIKAFLLLSVIGYLPGHSLNNFDAKFFHLCAIVLGMCALIEPPKRDAPNILVIPFGMLVVLNALMHNLDNAVMYWCLNASIFMFIVCVVTMYADTPEEYFRWIAIGAMINISVALMQKAGFSPVLDTTPESHPGGLMGNSPRLSTYLAAILPIMWDISIPMFLACVGISLAGDPQCAIIGVAAVVVFCRVRNVYMRGSLIVLAVAGAVFLREHILESLRIRFDVWGKFLKLFFKAPLRGFGLGTIPGRERVVSVDYAIHSSVLQFVFGSGIFGALYVIGLMNELKTRIGRDPLSLSMVAIALLSIIEYPFEITRMWFTMASLIGLFIVKSQEKYNGNREKYSRLCFCPV
jgi:hypothetical protein